MRKNVLTGSPYEKSIGFSRASRIGPWIAVSGTAPLMPDGTTAYPGDVYRQTKRCLEIVDAAIQQAGGKRENVIRTRIFLVQSAGWEEAAKAHGEFFSDIQPACSFIVIKELLRSDWLVEIEADCVIEPDGA